MPFENTHLFLADQVKQKLSSEDAGKALKGNVDRYFLGAVFPDTLFYSKDEDLFQTAYRLHGDDGSPTNRFVFKVLDYIRGTGDLLNFAFIAGYLTHCAADMTFHPVIFYLTGYDPNSNKKAQDRCSYRHWQYETLIDTCLNNGFNLEDRAHPGLMEDLIAPRMLGIHERMIVKALKRQRRYFSMVRSRFYYHAFRVLSRVGAVPRETVAGFYENQKVERISLPERIRYRDILTGESRETTLERLAEVAVDKGGRLTTAAYRYYTGKISAEECKKTIAGENLDTGLTGKTRHQIRFWSS